MGQLRWSRDATGSTLDAQAGSFLLADPGATNLKTGGAGVAGRSEINAADATYLMNIAQGGRNLSSPSYNYLPFMDADGYPNLNGGNPAGNITYVLTMPSDIRPNTSPGSNDGTELTISWTGSATTTGQGAIGTDFGGQYVSIASGGDPYALVDNGWLTLKFYMANNAGRPSGGKVRFFFNIIPTTGWNFTFFGGCTFASMSNLVICRSSDWASIVNATTFAISATAPEQMINPLWVNVYKDLNFSLFRPMGWTNPNDGNNCARHSYRKNWKTGLGFNGAPSIVPSVLVGSGGVIGGTNTYTASAPPAGGSGAYVDGETFQGFATNASTGTGPFTFNVAGRGPKQLYDRTGTLMAGSGGYGSVQGATVATFVFSTILDGFYYNASGIFTNVPIEMQCAAANQLGMNFWYNFPPFYDAASCAASAVVVRDQLLPTLSAWFEYGNEIWNNGFPMTAFARICGTLMGFTLPNDAQMFGFYAVKVCQLYPGIKTAWSPRSLGQLNRVMGIQSRSSPAGVDAYRFKAQECAPNGTGVGGLGKGNTVYNNYTGSADFTQAPLGRPIDHCEVISYAVYYSGGQTMQFQDNYVKLFDAGHNFNGLTTAADQYATGVPATMATALTWLDNDIRTGHQSGSSTSLDTQNLEDFATNVYPAWNTLAVTYGKWIDCYEGGHSCIGMDAATCTYIGISTAYEAKTTNLIEAYKQTTQFYTTAMKQFQDFMASANTKSRTPSWFLVEGPNAWSLTRGDPLSASTFHYTSYDMIKDWNHGTG